MRFKIEKKQMINQWGQRVQAMSNLDSRFILGVMSGTSADAIDLALVECRGSGYQTTISVQQTASIPWPAELRNWFFELAYQSDAPLENILELDKAISDFFAHEITLKVNEWRNNGQSVEWIGFSGQTVFHRGRGGIAKVPQPSPSLNLTKSVLSLQLGNPALLARKTKVPVIADFRKDHIALGFEGAPLSPLAEVLLYSENRNRATLNLGGIANITLLPAVNLKNGGESGQVEKQEIGQLTDQLPDQVKEQLSKENPTPVPVPFSSDAGPANTVMDQLVRREKPGETYDRDGAYASRGEVNTKLLEALLKHPFFAMPKPLSTGPEEFTLQWLDSTIQIIQSEQSRTDRPLALEDQLRTLCEVTAISVKNTLMEGLEALWATSIRQEGYPTFMDPDVTIPVYASGGGIRNPVLMKTLSDHLESTPFRLSTSEELGTDSDMKEAILFAVLANERIAGIGWTVNLPQRDHEMLSEAPSLASRRNQSDYNVTQKAHFCLGSYYFPE